MGNKDTKIYIGAEEEVSAKADKAAGGFKKALNKISSSYMHVRFAVTDTIAAIRKFGELAKEGAAIIRVEDQFARLANGVGGSSDKIIESLRKASANTITDLDLMKTSMKALSFEFSPDKLPKLMEIARQRGKQFGLTTTQAFEDIVTGVARGSPMILDNLGFMMKGMEGVSDKNKLMAEVIKQGEEGFKKYGDSVVDTADKLAQFETRVNNTLNNWKKYMIVAVAFAEQSYYTISTVVHGAMLLAVKAMSILPRAFILIVKSLNKSNGFLKKAFDTVLKNINKNIKSKIDGWALMLSAAGHALKAIGLNDLSNKLLDAEAVILNMGAKTNITLEGITQKAIHAEFVLQALEDTLGEGMMDASDKAGRAAATVDAALKRIREGATGDGSGDGDGDGDDQGLDARIEAARKAQDDIVKLLTDSYDANFNRIRQEFDKENNLVEDYYAKGLISLEENEAAKDAIRFKYRIKMMQGIQGEITGLVDSLKSIGNAQLAQLDAAKADGLISEEKYAAGREKIIKRQNVLNKALALVMIPLEIAQAATALAAYITSYGADVTQLAAFVKHTAAAVQWGIVAGTSAGVGGAGRGGAAGGAPAGGGSYQGGGGVMNIEMVVNGMPTEEDTWERVAYNVDKFQKKLKKRGVIS